MKERNFDSLKNAVKISADSDGFFITTKKNTKWISRNHFISDKYKYQNEILAHLKSQFNIPRKEDIFCEESAKKLIEKICESNRLLF